MIADLLQAWITLNSTQRSYQSLDMWTKYLIRLRQMPFTSQRLRLLTIHSIECLGFHLFQQTEVEEINVLLGRLGVGINDVASRNRWLRLLLDIVQSPEGRRSLGYP